MFTAMSSLFCAMKRGVLRSGRQNGERRLMGLAGQHTVAYHCESLEDRVLLSIDGLPSAGFSGIAADANSDAGHVTHVDVPLGVFNTAEIEAWESVRPDSSQSTKTPPPEGDGSHEDDILTIVLDFNEAAQPDTTDIFGNVVSTFDATAYGFASGDVDTIAEAVLAEVDFDYFGIPQSGTAVPAGEDLRLDFMIGDIGTAPVGVSDRCLGAPYGRYAGCGRR